MALSTFSPQEFQSLETWLLVHQIRDVHHPLCKLDSEPTSQLWPYLCHCIDHSRGVIFVTFVPSVDKQFPAWDIANAEDVRWTLLDNCWDWAVDGEDKLNVWNGWGKSDSPHLSCQRDGFWVAAPSRPMTLCTGRAKWSCSPDEMIPLLLCSSATQRWFSSYNSSRATPRLLQ